MKRYFKSGLKYSKSLFILLVFCLSTILGLCDGVKAKAYTQHTADEAVAYLHTLVGKKVGSGQCVALIVDYYQYLGVPRAYGNGEDYATNALPAGWTRIRNAQPQKGDIMIWTGTTYGHVAICGGEGVYFHQNWDGLYVSIKNKSYTGGYTLLSTGERANYWGVIRPDFNNNEVYSTIDEGTYYLRNVLTDKYVAVADGVDAEAQDVRAFGFYPSTAYQFEVKNSTTTAGYVLRPLCSSSRVLNVYADTVASGKNVCIYHDTGDASQRWYFDATSGGYVLRTVQNTSCVLDVDQYSNVCVYTAHGGDSQLWVLENAVTYDANGGANAPATQIKTYGQALTLSSTIPTRDGYCFLGWSTESSATELTYFPGEQYNTNENITLYAVWEKESSVKVLVGDVNSDGCVDSTDARMTLQYAVDKIGDDSIDIAVANVDGNEAIDSTDARLILQYAVGKTKNFPVETRGVGFVCGVDDR